MGFSLARLFGFAALACTLAKGSVAFAESPDAKSMHARTTKFSFQHKRYMFSRQGPGSIAYVPSSLPARTTEPLPVVVFLHGLNEAEKENPEFDGSPLDPRIVADELVTSEKVRPFVLAAPTHSRYARGTRVMWHDFDLDAFLDSTQEALGARARIDRNNVILVGHSGGGCNPSGGLLAPNVKLRAALAIDTCLDEKTMPALLGLAERTPVYFGYQRTVWQRPFDEFAQACSGVRDGACKMQEFTGLGRNPHREVLRAALSAFLPELLPVRVIPPQKAPSNVSLAGPRALPPKA